MRGTIRKRWVPAFAGMTGFFRITTLVTSPGRNQISRHERHDRYVRQNQNMEGPLPILFRFLPGVLGARGERIPSLRCVTTKGRKFLASTPSGSDVTSSRSL